MTRDEPGYRDLVHFVDSKVVRFWTKAGSTGARARSKKTRKEEVRRRRTDEGTCIRCGDSVRLNPERPLCPDCYDSWVRYENPDYEENFCHACGEESETSMRRPLCGSCYSRR
jgi:Zn finger protein HypA/HybF involved in hydrogenase expression